MKLELLPDIWWKHLRLQRVERTDWCLQADVVGTNRFVAWKATRPEFPASVKTDTQRKSKVFRHLPEPTIVGINPVPDGCVVDNDSLLFALCKDDAIVSIILVSIVLIGGREIFVQLG